MTVKLNLANFFNNYVLDPRSPDLSEKDQKIALVATIAFGLTLGIGHLVCYLLKRGKISKESPQTKTTSGVNTVATATFSSSPTITLLEEAFPNSEIPKSEYPDRLSTQLDPGTYVVFRLITARSIPHPVFKQRISEVIKKWDKSFQLQVVIDCMAERTDASFIKLFDEIFQEMKGNFPKKGVTFFVCYNQASPLLKGRHVLTYELPKP